MGSCLAMKPPKAIVRYPAMGNVLKNPKTFPQNKKTPTTVMIAPTAFKLPPVLRTRSNNTIRVLRETTSEASDFATCATRSASRSRDRPSTDLGYEASDMRWSAKAGRKYASHKSPESVPRVKLSRQADSWYRGRLSNCLAAIMNSPEKVPRLNPGYRTCNLTRSTGSNYLAST